MVSHEEVVKYIAHATGEGWKPERVAVWVDQLRAWPVEMCATAAREYVRTMKGHARPSDFMDILARQPRQDTASLPRSVKTYRAVCPFCAETHEVRSDDSARHECDPATLAYFKTPQGKAAKQAKGNAACIGYAQEVRA